MKDTQNHWAVQFKRESVMACDLYLNKTVIKENKVEQREKLADYVI